MADYLARAQATLHHVSGVAENDVVNTWHFDGDDFPGNAPGIYHGVIDGAVHAFYNSIAEYLSNALTGAITLKIYNMADPEPRVPDYTNELSIGSSMVAQTPLPAEVCVVGSFRGALTSGIPVGTRRGRLFIGPLNVDAMAVTDGRVHVAPLLRTALRDALEAIGRSDIPAASQMSVRHSIYSPTWHQGRGATPAGSPAIDAHPIGEAFNDVTSGWVDDAFDTQRRRGEDATARSTYDVAA